MTTPLYAGSSPLRGSSAPDEAQDDDEGGEGLRTRQDPLPQTEGRLFST